MRETGSHPRNQIEMDTFLIDYRNLDEVIDLARKLAARFKLDFYVIQEQDYYRVTVYKPETNLLWSSESC